MGLSVCGPFFCFFFTNKPKSSMSLFNKRTADNYQTTRSSEMTRRNRREGALVATSAFVSVPRKADQNASHLNVLEHLNVSEFFI